MGTPLVVNQGLQRIGAQASQTSTIYDVARYIRSISCDIGATAFLAAHTKLNDSTDVVTLNTHFSVSDVGTGTGVAATTRGATLTVTHQCIFSTTQGNFAINRFALNDDTAANVTASATRLVSGITLGAGATLTKTADFTMIVSLKLTYSDGTASSTNLFTTQGLQRIAVQPSQSTASSGPVYDVARYLRTVAVDTNVTGAVAGDTTVGSGLLNAIATTNTISAQTVTHSGQFSTAQANGTIKRITLHDLIAASVTNTSASLCAAVNGQTLNKTSDFTLTVVQKITVANI